MITMLVFPQFAPKNELLMKTPLSKIARQSGYIPSTYDFFMFLKYAWHSDGYHIKKICRVLSFQMLIFVHSKN